MRLWSIHPKYLDTRGLTAVWRDALHAQQILRGKTRVGREHPQLERFLGQADPVGCIATYLEVIAGEASQRGFEYDIEKIDPRRSLDLIPVTLGQLIFEIGFLRSKLAYRDRGRFEELGRLRSPEAHPLFTIRPGEIQAWENRKDD
jgi:hypothetical protein